MEVYSGGLTGPHKQVESEAANGFGRLKVNTSSKLCPRALSLSFRYKCISKNHRENDRLSSILFSAPGVLAMQQNRAILHGRGTLECYLLEPHTLSKIVCASAASPLLPEPGSSREQSENSLTSPSSAFICVICG